MSQKSNCSLPVKICSLVFKSGVQHFIIAIIIFNAMLLGLETSPKIMDQAGAAIHTLDTICLGIFVLELLMKFIALRFS
jgi:voltage-gated sodium channel